MSTSRISPLEGKAEAEEAKGNETRGVRFAIAAIAGFTAAAMLYAVLRIIQALILTEPDPALVIWSEHAGFFWRGWTAVYGGGMVGFLAWLATERNVVGTTRLLAKAVVVTAVLALAQGVLVP